MAISFTIDGSWLSNNRGNIHPVVGARVEFWQRVSSVVDWWDKLVGTTSTDGSGQYFGAFVSGHQHDFYARLVLNDDQGARLHNWWTGSSWTIDTGTGTNSSGNIHNDLIIAKDNGASTPKCSVWQGARNAYQEYVQTIGAPPPSSDYDISLETTAFKTPFTTLSTTHWPNGYTTLGGGPQYLYAVNFHEFGHSVRHSFDGSFAHFLYDATRFLYARTHDICDKNNEGFGFNEGWAEFWATDWGATPPMAPCAPTNDMEREGDVAAALYGLSECGGVGRAGMVMVLQLNPGGIHSFADFAAALSHLSPECGVGVIRQGEVITHNVAEQTAISLAALRADVQAKLNEQELVHRNLEESYREALEAANKLPPCSNIEDCDELFQRATAPAALAGRIKQAEQVTSRLQLDLEELEDVDREQLTTGEFYARRRRDQGGFDRQTLTTVIDSTHRAMATLEHYLAEDSTGTLADHAGNLGAVLSELQRRLDSGIPAPESVQAPQSTFGETVSRTQPHQRSDEDREP